MEFQSDLIQQTNIFGLGEIPGRIFIASQKPKIAIEFWLVVEVG